MSRRANPRAIKTAITYTIEEASEALSVTPQTIRSWERKGLKIMNSRRPHLVNGAVLREFLETVATKRKQPLNDDELLCMRCREPTKPYGMMADYVPFSKKSGLLKGICSECEGPSQRFSSPANLERLQQFLEIVSRDNG